MRRILFGPFCGELGWEVARWHAHLGWLRENGYKDDYIIACSYPDRKALYPEADEFISLPEEFLEKKYPVSGYIIYPRGWKREQILRVMRETEAAVMQEQGCDMSINGWLRQGSEETPIPIQNQIFQKLEPVERRDFGVDMSNSIVVLARGRKDIAPYKNWHAEVWIEIIEWLRSKGYQVILAGKPSGNLLAHHVSTNILNMIEEESTIGLLIDLMNRAKFVIGNVSGTMHLANLCLSPSIVFGPVVDTAGGALETRFTQSENPLGNKVNYIRTGKYRSPEFHLPFEKIKEELEKIL